VTAILAQGAARAIHRLPLAAVRAGAQSVREALGRAEGGLVAADAETDADLAVLASATVPPLAWLLAGSAGLGQAVAIALRFPRPVVSLPPGRAWLWVVGSVHAASRAQLAALEAAGAVGVYLDGAEAGGAAFDISAVARALERGRPGFLASAPGARLAPREAFPRAGRGHGAGARPGRARCARGDRRRDRVRRAPGARATRLDLLGAPASGLALGAVTAGMFPRPDHGTLPLIGEGRRLRRAGSFSDPPGGTGRMSERIPLLGITMGDPAGVGPEITAKALALPAVTSTCRPVVIGSGDVMAATLELLHSPLRSTA
jgi:hypothetical protein